MCGQVSEHVQIDGFEIGRLLGRGGMSAVWKARQISLDRQVAIKVLVPNLAADPDDVQRFHAEARAAARLKHPGIVQVYDAGVQDACCYFVMELVDGYTVGDWLRRKGRLSEDHALSVAEHVATALDYALSAFGMIHCDIKPDNIMIDADGTVKITDLGLARTLSTVLPAAAEEDILGTPAYMSPEQVQGRADLDCRTDIYALGATLYHMVTGAMLFQGRGEQRIMDGQLRETVADAFTGNRALSPHFCYLIERMLTKDRQYRQTDWKAVARDLAAVRAHVPLPSGVLSPGLSTMERDPERPGMAHAATTRVARRERPSWVRLLVLGGILGIWIGVAGVVGYFAWRELVAQPRVAEAQARAQQLRQQTAERAMASLLAARQWVRSNPNDYAGALVQLQRVIDLAPGTLAANEARRDIAGLDAERRHQLALVQQGLEARAASLAEAGDFQAAARTFDDYGGMLADELRVWRAERAAAMRRCVAVAAPAAEAPEELPSAAPSVPPAKKREPRPVALPSIDEILQPVATALVTRGLTAGNELLAAKLPAHPGLSDQPELAAAAELIAAAVRAEQGIPASFVRQVGQTITVRLNRGSLTGVLVAVNGGTLVIEQRLGAAGVVQREVFLSELHSEDRLRRLGAPDNPGVLLARGLWAYQNGARPQAVACFEKIPGVLGHALRLVCQAP